MNKPGLQNQTEQGVRPFTHSLRVSYAHCTLGNHVYYARYLDLLEEARGEFFRKIAFTCKRLQEQDTIFQVTHCSVRYVRPARYDDLLEIRITLAEIRKVRLRFDYEIWRGNELLLEASTHMVCASTDERPKRIPEELLKTFAPFEKSEAGSILNG